MKLNPYLMFDGNCEEAFKFYAATLGGKGLMVHRFGDNAESAGNVSAEWRNKLMHARVDIDGVLLMGSDAPPGRQQAKGGFSVSLNVANVTEGERIFKALSEKGHVVMPFGKTFWALGFGMCVDRFGTPWMVNCEPAAS